MKTVARRRLIAAWVFVVAVGLGIILAGVAGTAARPADLDDGGTIRLRPATEDERQVHELERELSLYRWCMEHPESTGWPCDRFRE